MKKKLVLISLFVLPIVVYLFFASGIYNFAQLPVITTHVKSIDDFALSEIKSVATDTTAFTLNDRVTILGYLGDQLQQNIGYTANLNLTIYKYFQEYEDFQMVFLINKNNEAQIQELKEELARVTDVDKFRFAVVTKVQATTHFESLKTPLALIEDSSSPFVFIIDKTHNLRSRNDDAKKQNDYGYDITQAVETGYLKDDIKVVLAEYRRALKKNNNASPELEYRPQ